MRPFRRFVAVLAAGLVVAAVGCSSASSPAAAPTTTGVTAAATTTTTTQASATADVRVYFLRGNKLDVAHRTITATPQIATAAITELLAGPTPADLSAGLSSPIPSGTRLRGIDIAAGTATIDLTATFADGGPPSLTPQMAQVTFTLTQFSTVQRVVFRLDGQPMSGGGGQPATRTTFDALAPPILVEFPGRGWAVHSPLQVTGAADVFEAQFQAELTDATGRVLVRKAVTATSGTGTRGTFSTTLAFRATADGPGTLTLFDLSPKDGSRIDVVQIPVELVAG
jgi:hypothetical protein